MSLKNLRKHKKKIHGSSLPTIVKQKKHKEVQVIQKGTYACNYCNEKFARETSLKRHIGTQGCRKVKSGCQQGLFLLKVAAKMRKFFRDIFPFLNCCHTPGAGLWEPFNY